VIREVRKNAIRAYGFAGTDPIRKDPLLLPPALNAPGKTMTLSLQADNPAIRASKRCPATDQRGVPRKQPCDIGAYDSSRGGY